MGRLTEIVNDCAPTGSVLDTNITNASIDVDVTVADYISVTQSGAYLAISGETTVTQTTDPWVISGLTTVTQDTSPWVVLGSVNVDNQVYSGSTYYVSGLQEIIGSVNIDNTVVVLGSVNVGNPFDGVVTQSGDYLAIDTYPALGGTTKHEGIHMGISGTAAATNFSGLINATNDRFLKQATVYGGLADDDFINVRLSGLALTENYVVSGVWTKADSSHSFLMDKPVSWTSGAELRVFVDNNTAKEASVNASIEWIE